MQSHSALRIVAACQSTTEFVAAYSRYCEGRSLFIATKSPKPIGQIVKFKVALASGEHLMTGVGPVVEVFGDRDNRFSRPGMRVEVEKLDASGRHWMEKLRAHTGGHPGAPAVASSPTGLFSTVSDESIPVAASPPPSVESAPALPPPRPVPVEAAPAPPPPAPPVDSSSAPPPPARVARSVTPPAGVTPSITPPAGVARSVTPPAGVARSVTPPAGVPRSATPPAGVARSVTPPAGVPRSETPPAGVPRSETPPAGVARSVTPPAGVARSAMPPAGVARSATPPAGVARSETPPAGVARSETPPAGVARSETPPAGVARSETPPVAVAPPVLPPTPVRSSAVPVPIADGLSAGWELDGLPDPLPLPRPRSATAPMAAASAETNGDNVADKNGEKPVERAAAVAVSGELDVPPPLPPPPTKGRSKRITFPALMFNKPRGLAVPAPSGAVVPKPLALLPAAGTREGKLRPATEPILREPAAPVAPLGTPSDTEPHVMVPPELESSLARTHSAAEGTPPPAAEPAAASLENHPDIADAPPEEQEVVAPAPPPIPSKRSKASTTTPPPVWNERRTVTQTLAVLVGRTPDPGVQEETVHWTNPGFAALTRPTPPQVDIVEEDIQESAPTAVPVVVGVEITSDVMDQTVISPPPIERGRRLRLVAALVATAAAGLGGGYYLGVRQGLDVEKMPVGEVSAAAAAPVEKNAWVAECPDTATTDTSTTATNASAVPAAFDDPVIDEPEPNDHSDEPVAAASAAPVAARSRARAPEPQPSSSPTCYLNAMTSPVGATVLIDGKVSGQTPLRAKVACGHHSVRFEMRNFQAATRSVTARRGETEKVSAELSRPRAVLRVESTPSGATVLVNGSSVGVTPLTTTVAGFVSSSVTLSKPGYKSITRQVSPTGSSARIGVTFKPDLSAARHTASPRR